jgi:nucleotidyltransferase/DNA polymerase involved in DNA repair
MASFSASVIWIRIESIRRSISADDRVGACADAESTAVKIKAAITQSLRIMFSFGVSTSQIIATT